MGLLDFMGTGVEDPRWQATNALAQSLLGRGGGMQRLAGGLGNYGSTLDVLKNQELKRALAQAQIDETQAQAENRRQLSIAAQRKLEQEQAIRDAFTQAYRSPEQQAMGALGGPTNAAAAAAPKLTGQWDQQALIRGLTKADPLMAYQMAQPKADELMSLAPGASVFNKRTGQISLTAPDKADKPPGSILEYQFAVSQGFPGTYEQWATQQKRAGASNVSVKVDNKLGEVVAAQVGPMVKASYEGATGAAQSIVNADSLIRSIDSGKVYTGPFASWQLKAAQYGQKVGIVGSDTAESIKNTRATIQSLAQATLDARSQLKGQGQVSNWEGGLVEKAASGNIDDMTAPEIRQVAVVNKRLANQLIQQHKTFVGKLKANETTAPLANMFELNTGNTVNFSDLK
jgi:hypothetical protein